MKPDMTHLMFNGKNILRFGFMLCSFLLLSWQEAGATHIVGGNLTYRCIGPNQFGVNEYEIRLTVRRDCLLGAEDAPFDNPASVGFFDAVTLQRVTIVGFDGELKMHLNNNDTLNEILVSDCSVISGDVCVHTTTYVDTIQLPYLANGYLMAYQRCCRNMSITNLLNPDDTGMTLVAELSSFAQTECNSSPQFNAFPPIYVCVNKEIEFNSFATDAENDSLVYSLCVPNAGGDKINNMIQPPPPPPYAPVVYRPPYNLGNLMGGVPLAINSSSGLITGMPNTIGQFVVGICVEAYDRETKQLTGVTRRDFQFNVRPCRDVPVALFSAPSLTCDGLTITFDNQSLLSDDYLWYFNFDDTLNSATSTQFEPTFTFPNSGFFNVALITSDSNKFCYDTVVHTVGVFDDNIVADFTYDVSACDENGIVLEVNDASIGFGNFPGCDWEWLLTGSQVGVIASVDTNPVFEFDIDGQESLLLAMVVTSCNGCTASVAKSFPVHEIVIPFTAEPDHFCFGDTIQLLDTSQIDCGFTYIWGDAAGLNENNGCDAYAYPGISTEFIVTVTDGLCEVIGSNFVEVQQLPQMAFTYDTDCKSLQVNFDDGSEGNTLLHWDFGVPDPEFGDTSILENPSFTYPDSGTYIVTLTSRDGCGTFIQDTITANAITEELTNTTLSCFKEPVELNPDNNPGYNYSWSPTTGLSSSTSPNPVATVDVNTVYYVTITSPSLPDCEIVDSILVESPDDFFINASADDTICAPSSVILTATTNLVGGTIEWFEIGGGPNPIGNGTSITVNPDTTTTYMVVGTNQQQCDTFDLVTVNYMPGEPPCIAQQDTSYCNIQTITLNVCEAVPGLTYEWFNAAGETVGEGPTVDVTPGSQACFEVISTDQLGCQGNEIICLTPTFFDLDITDTDVICLEDSISISVSDNNNQNLSYVWFPDPLFGSGQGTNTITVSPPDTTLYTVIVTNNDVGCVDTLTEEVVVSLFDPVIVTLTGDCDSIIFTQSCTLHVNQNLPNLQYIWESSGTDIVPGGSDPVVTPSDPGNFSYTVTVINEAGCEATATYAFTVQNPACDQSDIYLPNAFSPNGDGKNDVLYVRSNFVESMTLFIYNRWGEEVFRTNSINVGWDGTFNGKELPPDVFGYYLDATCPNQATYQAKGNISIIK